MVTKIFQLLPGGLKLLLIPDFGNLSFEQWRSCYKMRIPGDNLSDHSDKEPRDGRWQLVTRITTLHYDLYMSWL